MKSDEDTLAAAIAARLDLQPHPEGGYYRETYRSRETMDFGGIHNVSTCIYFLLTEDTFSAFHRIRQDEIWHFYDGSTLLLHTISPEGEYRCVRIGNEFENGDVPQFVVTAGTWFAAEVPQGYALTGCTVAPGFDFLDFELAETESLSGLFPLHRSVIERLCR